MKKRYLFIPICILAIILACFLFLGHQRRDEVSDIMARQLSVDETSTADTWINSSDTTYNWVHRSLDFSIGVDTTKEQKVSVVFIFTKDQKRTATVRTSAQKLNQTDETIFHASIPYEKLSEGDWLMSAYLLDENKQKVPLKNPDTASEILAICAFHVR